MLEDAPCVSRFRLPLEQHSAKGGETKGFLILPGERLCLLGSPSPEGLIDPVLVPNAVASGAARQQLISVELASSTAGSFLVVKNHHDRLLTYRAVIKAERRSPAPTSVCDVMANLSAVEQWAENIEAAIFGGFKLLGPGAKPECK